MKIRQANPADIGQLAELFAQYRVFYGKEYELDNACIFLEDRIRNKESVVFIAVDGNEFAGFTQLYPSFTSVGMKRIWILNDLFVAESFRKKGVAQALIKQVIDYSRETGRSKVVLSTAFSNSNAQRLYEKTGFVKDEFYNYEIAVVNS